MAKAVTGFIRLAAREKKRRCVTNIADFQGSLKSQQRLNSLLGATHGSSRSTAIKNACSGQHVRNKQASDSISHPYLSSGPYPKSGVHTGSSTGTNTSISVSIAQGTAVCFLPQSSVPLIGKTFVPSGSTISHT